jgi:hypothetical protein
MALIAQYDVMLSVANKSSVLSVNMINVVMLSVVKLNVMVPLKMLQAFGNEMVFNAMAE